VRYVFSEDSVQIISSAREHSQMVAFNACVRPVETADALYLLTLNPFVVIVLPKFAFSPDLWLYLVVAQFVSVVLN
jgi:hypothetical protein